MLAGRRSFLAGATTFLAAPAIVRVGSLMPVSVPWEPFTRRIFDTSMPPLNELTLEGMLLRLRADIDLLGRHQIHLRATHFIVPPNYFSEPISRV